MSSNLVVTAASIEYFHYLDTWIKSFHLNEVNLGKIDYHVTVILKNQMEELKVFECFKKNINRYGCVLNDSNYSIHYVDVSTLMQKKAKHSPFVVYCAHHKFSIFHKFKHAYARLLWVDCDAIINGSLLSLFELSTGYDFMLKFRETHSTNVVKLGKILAGVILINNTDAVSVLYKSYMDLPHSWYNDQLAFGTIIDRAYNIKNIPTTYFSFECAEDHCIWLCKGNSFPNTRDVWVKGVNNINQRFSKL